MNLKEMTDQFYGKYDIEAAKILDSFLPDRIFDAHAHMSHLPTLGKSSLDYPRFIADMRPVMGERALCANCIPMPLIELRDPQQRKAMMDWLLQQLECEKENVGEALVFPSDTTEDIEAQLIHPRIRGLKCYHIYADRENTFDATIGEYLPEAAWQVANKHGLAITLHMVRNQVLADEENLTYIQTMTRRYPDAKLILAHAARAFAPWTAIETVERLKGYDNIYFDFAGVCETPAMQAIIQKLGLSRCMWGSDWSVSMFAGKCIALADTFYWIGEKELQRFSAPTEFHTWLVSTENLMAMRQLAQLLNLKESQIEDLFFNNAKKLFGSV